MHMQDNVVIAVAQHLPRSPGDASGSDSKAHRSSRQQSVSAVRGAGQRVAHHLEMKRSIGQPFWRENAKCFRLAVLFVPCRHAPF
jgi:hypothetical protein